MHGVSDININWAQGQQIFAASVRGPDLFKCYKMPATLFCESKYIWYDIRYDIYLLQLGFHLVAVVSKLVQK